MKKFERQAYAGLIVISWVVLGIRAGQWHRQGAQRSHAEAVVPVRWLLDELAMVPPPKQRSEQPRRWQQQRPTASQASERPAVDLNTADSAALESMPYIGPFLAGRICRFREALGGFDDVEQLREVWGLRPESADKLIPRFHIGQGVYRTLCADTSSWSQLRSHPYIGSKEASAIERYRRHHPLESIGDLTRAIPITDSMIRRWSPYLRICENRGPHEPSH
jgi:DNA uptake protein ComE-like DNA-binding protein